MIKWIATIIFLGCVIQSKSQNLAAFHDYRKYLIAFDNGKFKELEHLPVQSFQVGGNYISYISNSGQFKIYINGRTVNLTDLSISNYFASPYLMVYQIYNQLYVFDNENVQILSSSVENFAVGDSIIAYFNENTYSSEVYYNKQIYHLEKSLVGNPVLKFSAGDNLIAYYNENTKYLKSFYNGKVSNILQSASPIVFQAGRDILAYINYAKNSFHIFYKGEFIDLEDYVPKSFKVGDGLLAYIDNLDGFKIFYNGEIQTISTFEPDFYDVVDSLVIFSEQGYLRVFYKGEIVEYENFVPEEFQAKGSSMAFIGPNGWLMAFIKGEFVKITSDIITSYSLNYNTISINTTKNKTKVFFNGKLYDMN